MQETSGLTQSTQSIVDALTEAGHRNSESPALQWRDSVWTYRELLDAIERVRLRLASYPDGSRIALLLRNSPQYVALYYGTLSAGHVAVPLNNQERASSLARQIAHSGACLLLGDPAHKEWDPLCVEVGPGIEAVTITPHDDSDSANKLVQELGEPGLSGPRVALVGNRHAVILYTSGTTGHPKGVMLSHRNLLSNAVAIIAYLELTIADRGLCVLPFFFSYGNSVLNSHLLSGATLVIEDNFAFPHITLNTIQNETITGFAGVPSTFALLLKRCRLQEYDLSSLRYITQAGGAMPTPTIERLQAAMPSVDIFIMYGQTEATARLTYLPPTMLADKCGSVGIPIDDVEIEVRENGHRVSSNTTGEVYARGPNVMLGYWQASEATARTLQDGWLKTGDLGHLDEDGYLYIDGRAVEMIKVGAFRVSPQEVEEVISELAGVDEVAVVGIGDELLGQAIMALVVPEPDSLIQTRDVKAVCLKRLSSYKVPSVVKFVTELPRTASGKLQRLKLTKEENK